MMVSMVDFVGVVRSLNWVCLGVVRSCLMVDWEVVHNCLMDG